MPAFTNAATAAASRSPIDEPNQPRIRSASRVTAATRFRGTTATVRKPLPFNQSASPCSKTATLAALTASSPASRPSVHAIAPRTIAPWSASAP